MPTNILSLLVAFGRQRFQTALLVAAIRYVSMADENRETQIDNKTHVLLNLIQIRWRHLQNQIHLL